MSITLPRNFAPISFDEMEQPKTPDQGFPEVTLPPPPHHTTLRRPRRLRGMMGDFAAQNNALPATLFASEIPVPSSDVPMPSVEEARSATLEPSPSENLRLPAIGYREMPPPRTPAAQTTPTREPRSTDWDRHRSSSTCSSRSDSSYSSAGTFTSRPTSFGGSATSPECDMQDPFLPRSFSLIPATPSRRSKGFKAPSTLDRPKFKWTIEMDNHLWNVYQMYLADPTITPFKAAPGAIPPLGVCKRIARVAKRTWPKATKIPFPIAKHDKFRDVLDEANAVRESTPRMSDSEDDTTKIAQRMYTDSIKSQWPDKNTTRRHFKELCRQKFSIKPHYQRMRESRSPSPFTDPFSRSNLPTRITRSMARSRTIPGSSPPPSTSYATRDLGISLVSSGASGPLAQLVTGESPPGQSDEWFNTPVNSSSQAASSPLSGLGIDKQSLALASSVPRLASPFSYNTWDGPTRRPRRPVPDANHYETISAAGPRLLSPVRLDSLTNAHKRRAQNQLEDNATGEPPTHETRQELVFTGAGDISQRRIRFRSRGATLGSSSDNRDRLTRLFSPPSCNKVPPLPALAKPAAASTSTSSLVAPEPEDRHKRLGSPFELDANKRSNRSQSPRHIPSLSDPFVASLFGTGTGGASSSTTPAAQSQSIGERLAAFSALQGHDLPTQNLF
jgi:hypothetical protein